EILPGSLLETAPLPFGEAAPDTEAFVMLQRVFQTFRPHLARVADLLGFPRRAALLGEERLGVGLRAQRALLPAQILAWAVRPRDNLAHAHQLLPPCMYPPTTTPGRVESRLRSYTRGLRYTSTTSAGNPLNIM